MAELLQLFGSHLQGIYVTEHSQRTTGANGHSLVNFFDYSVGMDSYWIGTLIVM